MKDNLNRDEGFTDVPRCNEEANCQDSFEERVTKKEDRYLCGSRYWHRWIQRNNRTSRRHQCTTHKRKWCLSDCVSTSSCVGDRTNPRSGLALALLFCSLVLGSNSLAVFFFSALSSSTSDSSNSVSTRSSMLILVSRGTSAGTRIFHFRLFIRLGRLCE